VNASPAADSLPALMVYEAELLLSSARGTRRVPYVEFHTGYKQTRLGADEIIRAIALRPAFAGYYSYSRKVGTRNSQAIAKLCLAGLGKVSGNRIEDVRVAIGSMGVTPLRLRQTEEALAGRTWEKNLIEGARKALEDSVKQSPGQLDARLLLARIDLKSGDRAAAEDQLEAVLVSNPANQEALLSLATEYLRDRRFADVVDLLEPRAQDGSVSADALVLLVQAYVSLGRTADAEKVQARLKRLR